MPRQRKAQSGAQRIGSGRVANTTTSPELQTVYRIPTRNYGECEKLAYEVVGTSPIVVRIEGENVYRISLDENALQSLIESYEELDLSNVTLSTINGDVTFTGNITADGTFTGTSVSADSVSATTGNITNVTSTSVTTSTLSSGSVTTTGDVTVGGNLEVAGTSTLTGDVTAGSDLSVAGDLSVTGNTTTDGLTATTGTITTLTSTDATITNLDATAGDITTLTSDDATLGTLSVTGASSFTGDVSAGNISTSGNASLTGATISENLGVSGATTLNSLTVNGSATMTSNASVGGNLSVTGNETVTGNQTVTGDGIFSNDVSVARNLNVSGDTTITDDLTVNGSTHLNGLETSGSVDVGGTLRTAGAAVIGNGLNVTGQVESDTVRTGEVVTDELRVTTGLYLSQGAEAPDFVLQAEKGQPNGVPPLDVNGIIPQQYLPPVYTSAIVKMGTGVFSNSNTSTIVDEDITADSFVILSNYSDIIGDLNEVINIGQITVASNEIETGSYKYIIVNPLPTQSNT